MTDTLEQRIYDGDQARLVLENPAFAQAFADMKQEITDQWAKSPIRDADGRERLFLMLQLTNKLQLMLESSMSDGKMAKHHLDHEQRQLARERAQGIDTNGWGLYPN